MDGVAINLVYHLAVIVGMVQTALKYQEGVVGQDIILPRVISPPTATDSDALEKTNSSRAESSGTGSGSASCSLRRAAPARLGFFEELGTACPSGRVSAPPSLNLDERISTCRPPRAIIRPI